MTLGDIIKEYRTDHGMNIRDFATISGLSRAYVSLLERNVNPKTGKEITPSVEIIKKVADAVGKNFDEVFNSIDCTTKIIINPNVNTHRKFVEEKLPTLADNTIPHKNTSAFNTYCTEHESKVLDAYRERTEMQPVVDKLLDIEPEQPNHLTPIAAHELPGSSKKAIKNDDDIMKDDKF